MFKALAKKLEKAAHDKKTDIFYDADLNSEEGIELLKTIVFNMPGQYRLSSLKDLLWEKYGACVAYIPTPEIFLGLASLYPDKIIVSFTHDLESITVFDTRSKNTKKYRQKA